MRLGLSLSLTNLAGAIRSAFSGAALNLDFTSGNQTLDPRITFTRASKATRFNAGGTLVLMSNDQPRFDYDPVTLAPKGLLIEEQRTNSIRNNTMVGVGVGTPGTLPTNWAYGQLSTLTTEIVGSGVETGINYVDIRFSGTATTTALVYFEANSTVAATNAQTWATAVFVKRVGGSETNTSAFLPTLRMSSSTGTNLGFVAGNIFTLPSASASLNACRFNSAHTTNNASTAFVMPALAFNAAGAVDITLRIGMPQLELGAFATSVIPTTTASATRAADVATMTGANFSSWYSQTEGTMYVEGSIPFVGGSGFPAFSSVDDGTSNNAMEWSMWDAASDSARFVVWTGGVSQASITAGTYSANTTLKLAGTYKVNDFAASYNGAAPVTDTAGTVPTVSLMRVGQNRAGGNSLNGCIRKIAYYNRRLANSELQALTA